MHEEEEKEGREEEQKQEQAKENMFSLQHKNCPRAQGKVSSNVSLSMSQEVT